MAEEQHGSVLKKIQLGIQSSVILEDVDAESLVFGRLPHVPEEDIKACMFSHASLSSVQSSFLRILGTFPSGCHS